MMKKKMKWLKRFIFVVLLLLLTYPVGAGELESEQDNVQKLEDITITAKKEGREVKNTGTVKIVGQNELERKQLTTSSDVLKYLPSVNVVSRQPGADGRFNIRGLGTGGRTIAVSDGVTLSDFTSSNSNVNWSHIAPEEIEEVEVIYGPYSALYSGNAIGGAVSITTKDPETRMMSVATGYGLQQYEVYNFSKILPYSKVNAIYGDKIGKFHVFALFNRFEVDYQPYSFSTKTADSTSSGTGQEVTGWCIDKDPLTGEKRYVFGDQGEREELKYMGKLRLGFDLNEFTTIGAEYRHWTSTQDRQHPATYLRDSEGNPVWSGKVVIDGVTYSPTYYGYSENDSAGDVFQMSFKQDLGSGLKTNVVAGFADNYKNRTLSSSGTMPEAQYGGNGSLSDSSSGWYNVDWRSSYSSVKNHEFTAGIHYDQYFVDSESWKLSDWKDSNAKTDFSKGSEGKTNCYALFMQDEWAFMNKFSLYLGGRYEWWKGYDGSLSGLNADSNIVTEAIEARDENHFSPKTAVTYRPDENWGFRLSLAKAYRFPSTEELFYGSIDSSTGYTTQTNPDLKSEKTFAKDFSITRFLDGGSARLSFFENSIDDYILRQTHVESQINYYQNIEEVRIRGVEFEINKKINAYFKPGFNITYMDPEIVRNSGYPESEGKVVPRVAKWSGNVTLDITPMEKLAALVALRWQSDPYYNLDNSDVRGDGYGGDQGYVILDAKIGYKLNKSWSISVAVDNITDEEVYSFHPFNQRMYSCEMKWTY